MQESFGQALRRQFMSDEGPVKSSIISADKSDEERAFLEWANVFLRKKGFEVQGIEDCFDGVCISALIESLTGRQLNTSLDGEWPKVLDFIERERIPLPQSADSKSRREADALIRELLWSLILRFEFGKMEQPAMRDVDLKKASSGLLQWINTKIPAESITNFTTCWQDGTALCELVNAIRPLAISQSFRNDSLTDEMRARLAMQAADEHLSVPQLITAHRISAGLVAERAMVTYLALFCSADRMLRRGLAPVSQSPSKTQVATVSNGNVDIVLDQRSLTPSLQKTARCLAYGSGLRYGEVGRRSEFVVQLGSGRRSELSVTIECKPYNRQQTPFKPNLKIKPANENSYIVQYTPVRPGDYTVSVYYCDRHIPNSPFRLRIGESAVKRSSSLEEICYSLESSLMHQPSGHLKSQLSNRSQSVIDVSRRDDQQGASTTFEPYLTLEDGDTAVGSGLICGEVGILGSFLVYTPRDDNGPLSVCITCPAMSIPVPNVRTIKETSSYAHRVSYLPTEAGVYEIEVKWGKVPLKGSPYWLAVVEMNERRDCFLANNVKRKLPLHLPTDGKNAVLYYSATTNDAESRQAKVTLETALKSELPDHVVSPIPIDVSLSKDQREKVFDLAGSKALPMLFIDGTFIGDYDALIGYQRRGELISHLRRTVWHNNDDATSESTQTFGRQVVNRISHSSPANGGLETTGKSRVSVGNKSTIDSNNNNNNSKVTINGKTTRTVTSYSYVKTSQSYVSGSH